MSFLRWFKDNWLWMTFLLAAAVLISFVAANMVLEARADLEYVVRCEQVGGHALNINHDPLCVSSDGRVIEP